MKKTLIIIGLGILAVFGLNSLSSDKSSNNKLDSNTTTNSANRVLNDVEKSTITPAVIKETSISITPSPSISPKVTILPSNSASPLNRVKVTATPKITPSPTVKIVYTPTPSPTPSLSNNNYYENTYGDSVHAPAYSNTIPAGASAQCKDGTYSFSQSRSGTCSHHGGVAVWL